MSHRYIPLTDQDKQEMLDTIGAKSISELFGDVPADILLDRNLNIAKGEAETSLVRNLIFLPIEISQKKLTLHF